MTEQNAEGQDAGYLQVYSNKGEREGENYKHQLFQLNFPTFKSRGNE